MFDFKKKDEKLDGRSKEARELKEKDEKSLEKANSETLDGQRPKINAAKVAVDRPTRKKTAGDLDILTAVNVPDGYVLRVVNDEKDNITKRLDLGYQFVDDEHVIIGDDSTSKSRRPEKAKRVPVGQFAEGKTMYGYYMVQRKEWFDEDQATKQKVVDKTVEKIEEEQQEEGRYGSGLQIGTI